MYVYKGAEFDAHLPITEPTPRAAGQRTRAPKPAAKCGTNAGYESHRYTGVPQCQPCKDAHSAYMKDWKKRHRAGKIKTGWNNKRCGTYAGYQQHFRHAAPMCDPCRNAGSQYLKDYRARKAAA